MSVCHIQLSSHFAIIVHCFSVGLLVYLYIIQFKHSASETKLIKKSGEFTPNWSVSIFQMCHCSFMYPVNLDINFLLT